MYHNNLLRYKPLKNACLSVSECFGYRRGVPILKLGGYPYQNTIKCSTVKTKINLICAINDRQNESTRQIQQQNKIKKPEGKQQRNAKICVTKTCFSVFQFRISWVKHSKPHFS